MSNKESIEELERDIERLNSMLKIYEQCETLTGQHCNNIISGIERQIEDCKEFIWNLRLEPILKHLLAKQVPLEEATIQFIGDAFPDAPLVVRLKAMKRYREYLK